MRWLALLLLVPSMALAQVPNYRPGQSPRITSTVASGGDGLRLVQGAGVCFNSTTCTTRISYDGTDFIIDVPSSKGFQVEVNGSDMLALSSDGSMTVNKQLIANNQNSTKIWLGTLDASNTTPRLWAGNLTPSATNYYLAMDGNLIMNTPGSGAVMEFRFADTAVYRFNSSGLQGRASNGATAIGMRIGNTDSLTTDGAKITAFFSDGLTTEKSSIGRDGSYSYNTGGSDDVAGRATLVGGTVTVSTTAVETTDVILLTRCVTGGTEGNLRVGTVTADTSFVIESSNGADTSTVCWSIHHTY